LQNRDSYFSLVRSLLERHKIYPDAARRRGETGSVTVRFTISPSGALADIGVERSSGRKALDEAALLTVRRASPLPSPPVNDGQGLPVRVTITFHLTG